MRQRDGVISEAIHYDVVRTSSPYVIPVVSVGPKQQMLYWGLGGACMAQVVQPLWVMPDSHASPLSHTCPPPALRLASGRYASYWNAVLCISIFIAITSLFPLLNMPRLHTWAFYPKCTLMSFVN